MENYHLIIRVTPTDLKHCFWYDKNFKILWCTNENTDILNDELFGQEVEMFRINWVSADIGVVCDFIIYHNVHSFINIQTTIKNH